MIAEEDVTIIITTCRLAEGGRPKCQKFWPEMENSMSDLPGMTITPVKQEKLTASGLITKRTFSLTDEHTNTKNREVV